MGRISRDSARSEVKLPLVRHLLNQLGQPWCGIPGNVAATKTPTKANCRKCFAERLREMQRQARLRGEFWLLGEDDDYDTPWDRMTRDQVDAGPARLLDELAANASSRRARRNTAAMPGSREKINVLASRVSRQEATAHPADRSLEYLAAGLKVTNTRNGATLVLGVVPLVGTHAEEVHQDRVVAVWHEGIQRRTPGVWDWLSGESVLRRIERRLGRALCSAARALAAWPWG